jgi:hypothetical protein
MRKPKTNTLYIKKYFKLSTIPRLLDIGYTSQKEINDCPIITKWLDNCFKEELNRHVQDDLLGYILKNKSYE